MADPAITILQDSREQTPLKFTHKYIKSVRVQKLDVGDYMAEFEGGLRLPLSFERKSVADLYSTLTHGYDRFRKEMHRAKESKTELIIIVEGSIGRISEGNPYSDRTPESLFYQIFYIIAKYGVSTVFCSDTVEAAFYIEQVFIARYKHYFNSKKGDS